MVFACVRLLLGKEHILGQGVSPFAEINGTPASTVAPWIDVLDDIDEGHMKLVAGNGMHCTVLGAIYFFLFANLEVVVGGAAGAQAAACE